MYKIVVGEISPQRRANWFCGEDDPYGVWEGEALAEAACNAGTWRTADELLRDHTDIDWGSIAWRGNKEEITRLFHTCRLNRSGLARLTGGAEYAVVFIETVFGDSA